MLRRDQERLDAICGLLVRHNILSESHAHDLAHDLGDIEDAMLEWLDQLDLLRRDLEHYDVRVAACDESLTQMIGLCYELLQHIPRTQRLLVAATVALTNNTDHSGE